ncbi:hypothetical protein GN956_G25605 [Arapaima gigas]
MIYKSGPDKIFSYVIRIGSAGHAVSFQAPELRKKSTWDRRDQVARRPSKQQSKQWVGTQANSTSWDMMRCKDNG